MAYKMENCFLIPLVFNLGFCATMKHSLPSLTDLYQTPFYVYDAGVIKARARELVEAFKGQKVSLHYSVKANDNPAIIQLAAEGGLGACLVSSGEMKRAMAGDILPKDMLMNGVGKSEGDIRFALESGVGQLNVESLPELEVIAGIARTLKVRAPIGIRLNPEVTATTHTHITTGRRTDKFGLLLEDLPKAKAIITKHPELNWIALSCHIGSQIRDVHELEASYRVMVDVFSRERMDNKGLVRLDLGGGFGVSYTGEPYAAPSAYAAILGELTKDLQSDGVTIQLEPGRYVVAESGWLVTKVLYVKNSGETRFLVVDAGMNDLMRPSLYGAYHPIISLRPDSDTSEHTLATIVGPVCESADVFAKDRMLPSDIQAGEYLAITHAGAYGMTMSGGYNARTRLAEVLVEETDNGENLDGKPTLRLIRKALSAEDYDKITLV